MNKAPVSAVFRNHQNIGYSQYGLQQLAIRPSLMVTSKCENCLTSCILIHSLLCQKPVIVLKTRTRCSLTACYSSERERWHHFQYGMSKFIHEITTYSLPNKSWSKWASVGRWNLAHIIPDVRLGSLQIMCFDRWTLCSLQGKTRITILEWRGTKYIELW